MHLLAGRADVFSYWRITGCLRRRGPSGCAAVSGSGMISEALDLDDNKELGLPPVVAELQ